MNKKTFFGEYLRELRVKAGYGLREFAKKIDMQPSNLSVLENGRTKPPRDKAILQKIVESLGLKKGTKEWNTFHDLAVENCDRIPADIMSDNTLKNYLPVMMRTIAGSKLSVNEVKKLIEKVKNYRKEIE